MTWEVIKNNPHQNYYRKNLGWKNTLSEVFKDRTSASDFIDRPCLDLLLTF
jgi:hypothetical protein